MGQRASNLNPFASRDLEQPNQEQGRSSRNQNSRNPADTNENGSGSPISERFFGSHFLMGGKRFDSTKDTYLFGTNSDIDYLATPVKFPYGVSETVSVLNALINIRRDSIRIIKEKTADERPSIYRIEFIYDCDVNCYIQLHYCAREMLIEDNSVKFDLRFPELKPTKRFLCKTGADQVFNEILFKAHQFDPQKMYYNGGFWFPLIIEMTTNDPSSGFRDQTQVTLCTLERSSQSVLIKPVKQKLITDGVVYLMQDVFGIENREANNERDFECSICKDCESDTILLPCRHLCLCHSCDESFLHNVKECPFCRSPVKALLTLDAIRLAETDSNTSRVGQIATEHINLIEALNGPIVRSETNTLSRASSLSSNSRKSIAKSAQAQRESARKIFQQQPSSESTNADAVELQDIRVQGETRT
ncbi:RING-type E3 ubiquitin transferase [Aphelenchoides bicaudatus]|nr:RING-type E3 ubiquitin transferase [Aphelenchoides bicaudatus]